MWSTVPIETTWLVSVWSGIGQRLHIIRCAFLAARGLSEKRLFSRLFPGSPLVVATRFALSESGRRRRVYPCHEYRAKDEQERTVAERQGWTKGRP
jgi:hypothetical protein